MVGLWPRETSATAGCKDARSQASLDPPSPVQLSSARKRQRPCETSPPVAPISLRLSGELNMTVPSTDGDVHRLLEFIAAGSHSRAFPRRLRAEEDVGAEWREGPDVDARETGGDTAPSQPLAVNDLPHRRT